MIHYSILNKNQKEILPLLAEFKNDFYLAGGTGLALQLGHRDSIDFDFFTEQEFDTKKLFRKIKKVFYEQKLKKIQEEEGTISIIIDEKVKVSFFHYPYKLLKSTISEPFLRIASVPDIAAMKISAIISRATMKDYVDIFFILDKIPLEKIIIYTQKKLPEIDENLIKKSLVYFDDVLHEEISFETEIHPTWDEIKERIKKEVLGSGKS